MNRRDFIRNSVIGMASIPLLMKACPEKKSVDIWVQVEDTIEWQKCKKSPHYFINNYVKLHSPGTNAPVQFKTNPSQDMMLINYESSDRAVIGKGREIGATSLTVGYALWMMIFKNESHIHFVSTVWASAAHSMSILLYAHGNLPVWLRPWLVKNNRHYIKMENGSSIRFSCHAGYSERCNSVDMLVLDDVPFLYELQENLPRIRKNGKFIVYTSEYLDYLGYLDYFDNFNNGQNGISRVLLW